MWQKELTAAISNKETVTIRLINGELMQGVPEHFSERVKLRNDNGVVWVPLKDIEHVNRLIYFKQKVHM